MSSHKLASSVNFTAFVVVGLLVCLLVLIRVGIESLFQEKKKRKERKSPPSCMTDPNLGVKHQYITLDDITLHYVSAGNPKNQLVVFLHGFPDFWLTWQKQITEFKEDHWVVAPDMRGYGESSKPAEVSQYRLLLLMEDVKALVEKLGEGRKAILVGHDWGGVVAWALTASHPNLVHRLVVINSPHPDAMRQLLHSSFDQMKRSWYMIAFQFPKMSRMLFERNDFERLEESLGKYGKEEVEAVKYVFSLPGVLQCAMNYHRANLNFDTGIPSGYIMVPTLILWGERSMYLSKRLAHLSIRRALGRVELLPTAGHWAHRECAVRVNDHIRSFLQSSGP
ncbi:epoxide hydrolase 4-like [Ornithodoros turicata]|uniref:epoxide hydrolase 4-like n=1 Tax=Ornithodoros turicata TaxID=34597 RepID=UPI00313A18F5